MPHACIVGATASLGEALCHHLAQKGYELTLFGHDKAALMLLGHDLIIRYGIKTSLFEIDITRLEQQTQWQTQIQQLTSIDAVFLLIGKMAAHNSISEVEKIITINFTGPAVILSLFAEKLSEQKKGKIAVVTSVAGERARASNYLYGSAKGGLTLFAQGLRLKLWERGVSVTIVKPGYVDTPMTYGMKSPLIASREYVAQKIIQAVEKNKRDVYIPFFWKFILGGIKLIPESLFRRLNL